MTMLPSGIATLLKVFLAVDQALAFTRVHGAVQFSSPKNHAQPVGRFNDPSVNETVNGSVPDVGEPVKLAFGGSAATTGRIAIASRTKIKREAHNTLRFTCTCFATIKTTPGQIRYITKGEFI
jgi:hypothetical protein